MPYTVKFLDDKLYQSLSFDADIKFESSTKYSKKIWILKNYKIQGGLLELTEAKEDIHISNGHSSFSINKSFKNDELIIEVVQNYTFQNNFDFFEKVELDDDTGDEELNKVLAEIKESDFSEHLIKNLIQECIPDLECNCESE
jgi:hypothetical protein